MADQVIADFPDRFQWVQDDLRALVSPRPILAEGWGLRPELVAPVAGSIGRMVVMVAAEEFRNAHRLGVRVIEVDGSRDAEAVADLVAEHFAPFLPEQP
ncbi:hypothetical protein ACGGAQ_22680 [Micromonospora sp. NPDC047557]|uniref:hypothetical protein n=1 Tax=Micromonospora sp. NPDC047557 TaxID=3364250 RepID=UPI0037199906